MESEPTMQKFDVRVYPFSKRKIIGVNQNFTLLHSPNIFKPQDTGHNACRGNNQKTTSPGRKVPAPRSSLTGKTDEMQGHIFDVGTGQAKCLSMTPTLNSPSTGRYCSFPRLKQTSHAFFCFWLGDVSPEPVKN